MKRLLLLAALCLPIWAQTAINDTLYLQGATPWTGQITVSWPAFTSCSGAQIAKGSRVSAVNAGAVSISLWATDCASPSFAYTATYRTMGGANNGVSWTETWAIPSSPSIVTLGAVRQSSTLKFFPTQIIAAGLADGAYCIAVESEKVTELVACGGGGGGPVTWSSITGKPSTFTPSAHASTHASGGSDPVTLAESQVTGLVSDLSGKASASALSTHIADTSNPHSVTKAQVGLGNVTNVAQEPALGNPDTDGKVLSSTAAGVRSWITPAGGGGGGTWGSITGTLSSQTDLSTALGLKAPLASPTFSGNLSVGTGLLYNDTTKQLNLTQSSSGNDYRLGLLRTNVVSGQIGSVLASVFSSSDTVSAGTSQNAVYGNYINNSASGCTAQGNCGTYSEPHTMGVLGKGEDTTSGNVTQYGVEGRVDGRGTGTGHKYVGVVGVAAFQGSSLGAELRGVDALATATTDGTTPLNSSTVTAFYARPIVGGAQKWSLYANDSVYVAGNVTIGGTVTSGGLSVPVTVASGTAVLGTSAISANSCATVVTVSATGVATTDVISATFNGDVSAVTGYGVASTDGLVVYPYPTANNVNFKVCNGTGSSITPGAATLNWRVAR